MATPDETQTESREPLVLSREWPSWVDRVSYFESKCNIRVSFPKVCLNLRDGVINADCVQESPVSEKIQIEVYCVLSVVVIRRKFDYK